MIGSTATSQLVPYTDQPCLAEGLASVLKARPAFRLDCFSQSFSEITEVVKQNRTGIVLLDLTSELTLSGLHGLRQADPRCQIVLGLIPSRKSSRFRPCRKVFEAFCGRAPRLRASYWTLKPYAKANFDLNVNCWRTFYTVNGWSSLPGKGSSSRNSPKV